MGDRRREGALARTLLGLLLVALPAGAQVRAWDYGERRHDLETRRFADPGTLREFPTTDPRWERAWPSAAERILFRARPYPGADRVVRLPGETERFAMRVDRRERWPVPAPRARPLFPMAPQPFRTRDWEAIRRWTHRAIASAEPIPVRLQPRLDPAAAGEPLSLADLNRFQFRSTHSREPGLPAERAGIPDGSREKGEGAAAPR